MKVVIDSNIYISALNFGGGPLAFIQRLAQDPDSQVFFSDAIVEETVRVLRDKFGWPPEDLREAESLIAAVGLKVTPTQTLDAVPADPDDNHIVECAIEADADFIVTGDRDLLRLGVFGEVRILRVAELTEVLWGQAGHE